ncbi:family 20 glycosylhydrolase, partial [uncultured Microbacterium sp.]|uniref:family 20 glycosylhydrolase n=1 Tax=uncultured Microbacterium sp. TaxID=191216 RepID=UPI0025D9B8EE
PSHWRRDYNLSPIRAAVPITDAPDLGYRAVSIDVARRFWTVAELKDQIRRMGWLKLNALQLHFNEDEAFRLASTNSAFSGLAPASDRYTRSDIQDLDAFAAAHGVTIVPEIDTPAHSAALTRVDSTRSLAAQCGASYSDVLDVTSTSVKTWVTSVYSEFLPWFQGPYFHIGNDEVPTTLNKCAYVTATGKTIQQLQTDFVNELDATVIAAGKRTVMWANGSDILPNSDIMFVNFGSSANAASLRSNGYDVIDTSWGSGSYQRFFVIPGAIGDARTPGASSIYGWTPSGGAHYAGEQIATWADAANTADAGYFTALLLPRQTALAERIWNTSATTVSYSVFTARAAAVGDAPGVTAQPTGTTTSGQPVHTYALDGKTPLPANRFNNPPSGYADGVGGLYGTTPSGKPASGATGKVGNAVTFTAGSNQMINIGDGDAPTSWTVTTWVRRTADGTDSYLFDGWSSAIKLEQYNTSHRVGITQFGVKDYSFAYTVPLNAWTHLAIVSDGAAGTSTLYADGAAVQTIAGNVPLPGGALGGRRAFGGQLDEFHIFNQALTGAQVTADFTANASNLLTGGVATASSVETSAFPASAAIDGSLTTRWSSLRTDPQSITVDMNGTHTVSSVRINWEAAYASQYQIQISPDNATWTTLATRTGTGGNETITGLAGSGRYLRILGTQRGTTYGYSIWELAAYGS